MEIITKVETQQDNPFRTNIGLDIFRHKYRHEGCETWEKLAHTVAEDVCGP